MTTKRAIIIGAAAAFMVLGAYAFFTPAAPPCGDIFELTDWQKTCEISR
jgi:hypothetical protein